MGFHEASFGLIIVEGHDGIESVIRFLFREALHCRADGSCEAISPHDAYGVAESDPTGHVVLTLYEDLCTESGESEVTLRAAVDSAGHVCFDDWVDNMTFNVVGSRAFQARSADGCSYLVTPYSPVSWDNRSSIDSPEPLLELLQYAEQMKNQGRISEVRIGLVGNCCS